MRCRRSIIDQGIVTSSNILCSKHEMRCGEVHGVGCRGRSLLGAAVGRRRSGKRSLYPYKSESAALPRMRRHDVLAWTMALEVLKSIGVLKKGQRDSGTAGAAAAKTSVNNGWRCRR